MQNNERQAGTEVQQSDAADVTTSSPTCTKPHVVRSFSSGQYVEIDKDGNETETIIEFPIKRIKPMKLSFWKQDWIFSQDETNFFLETDISSHIHIHNEKTWDQMPCCTMFVCNEQLPDLILKNSQLRKDVLFS